MTKAQRLQNLLPNGIPRWVRCYDNGGMDNEKGGMDNEKSGSADRYTVCFTGRTATERSKGNPNYYPYRAMSSDPYHPQGIGLWGSVPNHHCDVNKFGFAPMIGRKNHLGTRIPFHNLPKDCQKLVLQDYKEVWKLA